MEAVERYGALRGGVDGGLAGVAVPSVCEGRVGSGGEGPVRRAHSFRKERE